MPTPRRLTVQIVGDTKDFMLVQDGKTLTLRQRLRLIRRALSR